MKKHSPIIVRSKEQTDGYYYNKLKEHPNGYHGHYTRSNKPLVSKERINRLNEMNNYEIFQKYYHATKKLEHTLISNKDFVSVNDEEEGPKLNLMDDIYRRVSHHGEDFKRCDFMFAPVVNSIMITCATEESNKRIKSAQLKSNPVEENEPIPFVDLENEIKKLQQKRCEVKFFDRKNHRVNALPSKQSLELKQSIERKREEEQLAAAAAASATYNEYSSHPSHPHPPNPNHSPSFKRSSTRPKSASAVSSSSPAKGVQAHNPFPSPSVVDDILHKDSSTTPPPPRPRRPQTNQPSRYLSSNRKVQFSSPSSPTEASSPTQQAAEVSASNNRKTPLRREESSGIDDSLLQLSDDSDDEINDVFDTFNMKGVYLHKKRKALMGPSADNAQVNIQLGQQVALSSQNNNSHSPTTNRSQLNSSPSPQAQNVESSLTGSLTEKEKYRARIATQFLYKIFRKNSTITSQLLGEKTTSDEPVQIKPEILSLFPKSPPKRSSFLLDELDEESKRKKNHKHRITIKPKNTKKIETLNNYQKNDIQLQQQSENSQNKQSQSSGDKNLTESNKNTEGEVVEDDPDVWLEKRMAALLADYEAGEKRSEKVPLDEETRKIFDARTISIEISLLFRGFQAIDKSGDGFLSGSDIIKYCTGETSSSSNPTTQLTKNEIKNVVWLMDDHRRGLLTFDDVTRFYLRKRKEFLESSQDYKLRTPVGAEEQVKMRLHNEHDVLTECDMHSQPLLLFRILFFVAMQDSRGEVHLLTAFQNLSQLFGRAAEEQFNCIFLKNCLEIRDEDRETLSEFIFHLKTFRVRIQRQKIVFREWNEKKAALVRFSYKKAKESLIGFRRNAVGEIVHEDQKTNGEKTNQINDQQQQLQRQQQQQNVMSIKEG